MDSHVALPRGALEIFMTERQHQHQRYFTERGRQGSERSCLGLEFTISGKFPLDDILQHTNVARLQQGIVWKTEFKSTRGVI